MNKLENYVDLISLDYLLESLDHIKILKISRDDYINLKWDIIKPTWEQYNSLVFYYIYLPKDLKTWEVLSIIEKLNKKFNLEKYSKFNSILEKTKIMLSLIIEDRWEKFDDNLIKFIDPELIKKLQNIELKPTIEIKSFIKNIKKQRKINKKLKLSAADLPIVENELYYLFNNEFDLTFFRKSVDMLRFAMETITQIEQKQLENKDWEIVLKQDIEKLDKEADKLRNKIWIENLKKELNIVRQSWIKEKIESKEIEVVNKILKNIYEYPFQSTENDYGYQPNKILEYKEIQCVWFSILWHAFLSELGIKHRWLQKIWHSAIEVNIWDKKYYFDATYKDHLIEMRYLDKIWIYSKLDIISTPNITSFAYVQDIEHVLLSQILNNKWVFFSIKWKDDEAIKMYDKAININPYNNDAYLNKWNSLYNLWYFKKAIKMYDKAIELFPYDSNAYFNKWNILFFLWVNNEAIKMYSKSMKINFQNMYF